MTKQKGLPTFRPVTDIQQVIVGGEVRVRLANGCCIFSGWIDKDDPEARVSGDYLRLEAPDGYEIVYYGSDEWADAPAEVIGSFINACAGFAPEAVAADLAPPNYPTSSRGIPILPLPVKIRALEYCIENGFTEDALGHLFDLLCLVAPEYRHGPDVGLVALQRRYGVNPTPIREPPSPPE